MNGIRRFCLFLLLFLQIKSACSLCNMPSAWHGSWYQRGMNSLLEITIDHFQTKGHCQDVLPSQQYYLFTDRINRCLRCLLFIDRHSNLLQYRESECTDDGELSSITLCPNMIAPDAPLYTLYRNNSEPQLCPIQAPFLLTKLSKDGSTCTPSSSYIGECANDDQFRLHLSPCSSSPPTLDLQLACIGTWIEGFHTYFVTRILSEHHHRYACFYFNTKHKDLFLSSTFSLSMVTDDSCRYLNSKQMATVMTLSSKNRQIENELNMTCVFPEDLQQYPWYSLNHTLEIIITNNDIKLIDDQYKEDKQRFHCLQSMDSSNYRIRTFRNCDVKEECLRIHRQTNNVLELVFYNCHENGFNRTLIFLTQSNSSSSSSCLISIGHLLLKSNTHHHRLPKKIFQMSVGCDTKEKLMIYQSEKDFEDHSLTHTDTCLASWQSTDSSTIYIIAQSIYSNTSYCLTFQMGHSIIIRNSSHQCLFNPSEDERFGSIYSAKILHPCSQSIRISSNLIHLFLLIVLPFFFSSSSQLIDHSFQTVNMD